MQGAPEAEARWAMDVIRLELVACSSAESQIFLEPSVCIHMANHLEKEKIIEITSVCRLPESPLSVGHLIFLASRLHDTSIVFHGQFRPWSSWLSDKLFTILRQRTAESTHFFKLLLCFSSWKGILF